MANDDNPAGVRPTLEDVLKSANEAAEADTEDGFDTKLVVPRAEFDAVHELFQLIADIGSANEKLYDAYHKGGPGVDCSCSGCENYWRRDRLLDKLSEAFEIAGEITDG